MTSFRSRARRLAFGDSTENLSDTSSISSSTKSRSSSRSINGAIRHSSSISEQCTCNSNKLAHVKPKRSNRVRRIERHQPFELFVEALEADGCVIVQDFVNPQISQRVSNAEYAEDGTDTVERQARSLTIDVNSLIRESLVLDSLFQTLSRHFLSLETISWQDQQIRLNATNPCLSSSSTHDLNLPPATSAAFHRADAIYHQRHAAAPRYDYQSRRDASIGLIIPELDSLSATIDISTIPGSHLWDDQKPDISRGVKELELHGGEALILLGSLYHQIGNDDDDFDVETPRPRSLTRTHSASSPGTPKEKLMHQIWMCAGIYSPARDVQADDSET